MSEDQKKPRPAKVKTDARGRSVWVDAIETAQLELVSTQQLQTFLASDDVVSHRSIQEAASCGDEGVLARDAATGLFAIIDDFDIQEILDGNLIDTATRPRKADATLEPANVTSTARPEDLSLVSTQMLRKVLGDESGNQGESAPDQSGGFDPYNSN